MTAPEQSSGRTIEDILAAWRAGRATELTDAERATVKESFQNDEQYRPIIELAYSDILLEMFDEEDDASDG